jgi:putative FmdB family regulatory protein
MPTYEYKCDKCGRVFEVRQRISDAPLQTCEACGGEVRRLLSSTPFILKGGGWYVTDYPSDSRKKALESETKAETKTEKKTETKTEKKTETKSENTTKTEKKTDSTSGATTTTSAPAPSSGSTKSD